MNRVRSFLVCFCCFVKFCRCGVKEKSNPKLSTDSFALEEAQHVWATSARAMLFIAQTVFGNVARGINKDLAEAFTN